jgi:hypothetical protein
MKKDDFIKLLDGDNSYLDECRESVKSIIIYINIHKRHNIDLSGEKMDDIINNIIHNLVEHMVKFKHIWVDDEKNYKVRFRWNIVNWLYGYIKY